MAEPNPSAVSGSADFSCACQQTEAINRGFQRREYVGVYIDIVLDQEKVMGIIWSFHLKEKVLYFEGMKMFPMTMLIWKEDLICGCV